MPRISPTLGLDSTDLYRAWPDTTAGLRAYLPLLAVALGSTDRSLTHSS